MLTVGLVDNEVEMERSIKNEVFSKGTIVYVVVRT